MWRLPFGARRMWVLITAVALVAVGVAAVVWVVHDRTQGLAERKDCATVERLGSEWVTMSESFTAAQDAAVQTGDRGQLLTAADSETKMSDGLRAAADSVSTTESKEALIQWADGAALTARLQRDAVVHPSEQASDAEAQIREAISLIAQGTDTLIKNCPKLRTILHEE